MNQEKNGMIDIHAHLHDSAFDDDRDGVVSRALSVGVERMITVGTDTEESRKAISCAETYTSVFASVGVHPHVFNENKKVFSKEILEGIVRSSEKVVAIGECGLDYFSHVAGQSITEEQKKRQKEGFIEQIKLARELRLPLIVHTRPSTGSMDAYEDVYAILCSEEVVKIPMVLHCYMGNVFITEKFLSLSNLYFSFTGNITYKVPAGSDRDRTVEMIPLERILAETDCPYLAPVPQRGKRNEPAYMIEILRRVAEIRKKEYAEVEEQVTETVRLIFPKVFVSVIK